MIQACQDAKPTNKKKQHILCRFVGLLSTFFSKFSKIIISFSYISFPYKE